MHAVEGEQATVGAPSRPGAEEPGGGYRVQPLQRRGELVRRPRRRTGPGTFDVTPGREPVEQRAHVEQVPVEALAPGGRDRGDDRLVVGVDRGVDRAGLVPGDVRVVPRVEVRVGDPYPRVVREVPRLRPDLLEGAARDRGDRDRQIGRGSWRERA